MRKYIVKNTILFLVFYFTKIVIFSSSIIGCATNGNNSDRYSWEDEISTPLLKMMEEHDHLTGGHIMPDVPIKEPKMALEDREYLDEKCTGCHTLNRVFRTRGQRSLWKKLLGYKHHLEIRLEMEEKEKLYSIFQKYLSKL